MQQYLGVIFIYIDNVPFLVYGKEFWYQESDRELHLENGSSSTGHMILEVI